MADYLHGAYGTINAASARQTDQAALVPVLIGTAPVNTLKGGASNVNKPVLVKSMSEAKKLFGYSDDWASFTLCEAMHVFFDLNGVGPLVMINVLDPATHKGTQATESLTPANGEIVVSSAEKIVLDTVTAGTKVKGTDFDVKYDPATQKLTIYELSAGALGTSALSCTWYSVTPASVTASVVIGTTDGYGTNTGLYVIQDVYQKTGNVPAYLLAPGFSEDNAVHAAMIEVSKKINKHWDAYVLADLPLEYNSTAVTLATAATIKTSLGYDNANESVYWPMAEGVDSKKYHISVLAMANLLGLLIDNGGIPYRSPSNTECAIIKNLWLGAASSAVITDEHINEYLNKNGINSAAYVSGTWRIWGMHSAAYNEGETEYSQIFETSCMMLYYVSNDFQRRRAIDVDMPMTAAGLRSIAAEEQTRLDALVKIGALTYGAVKVDAESLEMSDVVAGDFKFAFEVTTTPLAKSLTAVVNWSDEGFYTYFEAFNN